MTKAILILFMTLQLGYPAPATSADCIWSFDTVSHRVRKGASSSDIFNGRFPEKYFIVGRRIFFFDSNGDFKKVVILRKNQVVRISERKEVIYVRDDSLIVHEGVRGPVELLDSNGDLISRTTFNYVLFYGLVELDYGTKYFWYGSRFAAKYYDSCLRMKGEFPRYHALDFAVSENRKMLVLLASTSPGIGPGGGKFLICTDFDGHIKWSSTISDNMSRLVPRLRVNDDYIVLSYEGTSSTTLLTTFDSNGARMHEIIIRFSPRCTSNIVGDCFAMLEKSAAGLRVHFYSAETLESDVLEIPSKDLLSPGCEYAIGMMNRRSLMLRSHCGDEWQYLYYDDQHRLADSFILSQRKEPIVFVEDDKMMVFGIHKRRICLEAR